MLFSYIYEHQAVTEQHMKMHASLSQINAVFTVYDIP